MKLEHSNARWPNVGARDGSPGFNLYDFRKRPEPFIGAHGADFISAPA